MLIVGARVSHPDPRINVGFREGTIIGAGEGMDDAVRLVYSGGEPPLAGEERTTGRENLLGGTLIAPRWFAAFVLPLVCTTWYVV